MDQDPSVPGAPRREVQVQDFHFSIYFVEIKIIHYGFTQKNISYISLKSEYIIYLWNSVHSRYRIFIDEREETNVENSAAVEFENVKVFAADSWWEAQPGSIKNLKINVKGN